MTTRARNKIDGRVTITCMGDAIVPLQAQDVIVLTDVMAQPAELRLQHPLEDPVRPLEFAEVAEMEVLFEHGFLLLVSKVCVSSVVDGSVGHGGLPRGHGIGGP